MSFDPKTGGPCYLADIRRGALEQIAQVRSDHEKWETPKVSEEMHTPDALQCAETDDLRK